MKKHTVGVIFFFLALATLGILAYLVFEPLQSKYIEAGKHPSLLPTLFIGAIIGVVIGTFFQLGSAFTKDKFFGVEHDKYSFSEMITDKSYLLFTSLWALGFLLIALAWAKSTF